MPHGLEDDLLEEIAMALCQFRKPNLAQFSKSYDDLCVVNYVSGLATKTGWCRARDRLAEKVRRISREKFSLREPRQDEHFHTEKFLGQKFILMRGRERVPVVLCFCQNAGSNVVKFIYEEKLPLAG